MQLPSNFILISLIISVILLAAYFLIKISRSDFLVKNASVIEIFILVVCYANYIMTWKTLGLPLNSSILNISIGIIANFIFLILLYGLEEIRNPSDMEGGIRPLLYILSLGFLALLIAGGIDIYKMLDKILVTPWKRDLLDLIPLLLITIFLIFAGIGMFQEVKGLGIIIVIVAVFLLLTAIIQFLDMSYQHVSFTVTGAAIIVFIGYLFFLLKKRRRKLYGIIEIFFSIYTAYTTINEKLNNIFNDKIHNENVSLKVHVEELINSKLSALQYFQLFGAIYIFIRGLDNIAEYNKTTKRSQAFYEYLTKDLEKAEMIFLLGVEKNFKSKEGNSYFHLAVLENNIRIIEFLNNKKMPSNLKNPKRQTPQDLAQELGYKSIVEVLEKQKQI